jgi:glutamate-1-semialdehyde aminotransferase
MGDSLEPRRSAVEAAPLGGSDATKATRGSDASSGVHNATTRVTIAWPFSQIKLQEASAELEELAGLLGDVIAALSDFLPEERLEPLRDRAEALGARLR